MTLRSLSDATFRKNDYFHRLMETVLCLARQGPAVFVGRSTDLILPKTKGLRVKLIASIEYCAARFAEHNHMEPQQAREEIARIETERREFIHNHFHIDAYDPMRFDLLVNVERFSIGQIVDLILAAHRDRAEA
jgi:cytidylate kinase